MVMSLEAILSEVFLFPASSIVDSLPLKEIPSWDSLTHMMLIVRLEEDYKIEFTGDEIADIQSVGNVRTTLQAHGVEL